MPILPAPRSANPTWCAASHNPVAVRSTPGSPMPAWGAAIQPASTSGVKMTRPVSVTMHAAIAPMTATGRASWGGGRAARPRPWLGRARGRVEAVMEPNTGKRAARPGGGTPTGQRLVAGHEVADEARCPAGSPAHPDADLLQRFLLCLGGARRTRHDGSGMPHGLAFRSGESRHISDNRLCDVLLHVGGGPFLRIAPDLADHHDRVGFRVVLEGAPTVDVRGPDDRVAADPDAGGEADVAEFVHHL